MKHLFLITLLYSTAIFQCAFSQTKQMDDTARSDKYQAKFTPFVAPSFAPETEFMIIGGGLYSFKAKPEHQKLTPTSIPFSVGYSTNNSFLFSARPYAYFIKNKLRIYGDLWTRIMPDNYWGVGYERNSNLEKGENTTSYFRKWWKVDLRAVYKLYGDIYGGLVVDVNSTVASKLNPIMQSDPAIEKYGKKAHNRGLGFNLEYDTRDLAVNAYEGKFINISSTFYGDYLNSDYNYQIHIIDYRQYETINRSGRTLAWQIKGRFGLNDVPWPELSQLGTPFDLRAYVWGHYRDKNMVFGIVEYRHMFLRKKPDENGGLTSKHGAVIWVGGGSISPDIESFNHWLPNAGVGYRFEVQERLNARVDIGFGRDAFGLYVSFNEAF